MRIIHYSVWLACIITFLIGAPIITAQDFNEVAELLNVSGSFGTTGRQGGGISVVDFNQDGWDDLTIATQEGNKLLFFVNNNGESFEQIAPLVPDEGEQKQILWVDYDNDDDLDLFFTQHTGVNRLYENRGDLNLVDVTSAVGLPLDIEDTFGAVFGDINQDGYLDLFISNYFFQRGRIFLNYSGLFEEITDQLFIDDDEPSTLNFCSALFDYDRDGDLDLYLINDKLYENDLYINTGSVPMFEEASDASQTNIIIDAMNAGIADINNDGLLDIYVTNSPDPGNVLLLNNHDGVYTDISDEAGVRFGSWCWGGSFADLNNDGFLDMYVTSSAPVADQNKIYVNNGDATFDVLAPSITASDTARSYANSIFDFNNDGLMDLVNNPLGADVKVAIWENTDVNNHNYLKVKLEGSISNRNGVGSWIEVYTDDVVQFRFTHCGISFLSQESYNNHFGVSDFEIVDSLIVRWPSGLIDKKYNIQPNQTIQIVEDCIDCPKCEPITSEINSRPIPSGNFHHQEIIANGSVEGVSHVLFRARESVELSPEFNVQQESLFTIEIRECEDE